METVLSACVVIVIFDGTVGVAGVCSSLAVAGVGLVAVSALFPSFARLVITKYAMPLPPATTKNNNPSINAYEPDTASVRKPSQFPPCKTRVAATPIVVKNIPYTAHLFVFAAITNLLCVYHSAFLSVVKKEVKCTDCLTVNEIEDIY